MNKFLLDNGDVIENCINIKVGDDIILTDEYGEFIGFAIVVKELEVLENE